jgi:hypothetical protein
LHPLPHTHTQTLPSQSNQFFQKGSKILIFSLTVAFFNIIHNHNTLAFSDTKKIHSVLLNFFHIFKL